MPRLKFFSKDLTSDLLKRAEIELGETIEVRRKSLEQIKNLIKSEHDFFPCMDDAFLLIFLRSRKFHALEAFKLLKRHYVFKAKNWGIITGFKPSEYEGIFEEGYGMILENMDDHDCGVAIQRFGLFDLDKYSPEELLSAFLLCLEVGSQSEIACITGVVIIQDYADFSFKAMMRLAKLSIISLFIKMNQNYIPGRLKALHIINAPEYCNVILRISKMFLTEKLQKRIHVHGNNLESLHKFVPPDILPKEYGGKEGSWTECVQKFASKVLSCDNYIDELNKYGYQGETLQKLRKHKM